MEDHKESFSSSCLDSCSIHIMGYSSTHQTVAILFKSVGTQLRLTMRINGQCIQSFLLYCTLRKAVPTSETPVDDADNRTMLMIFINT